MNHLHKKRLYLLGVLAAGVTIAVGLILYAFQQNINAFLTPQQLVTAALPADYRLRLGGMVKKGSVSRDKVGLGVQFVVTDFKSEVRVRYQGILPDLFREGKGVVVEGKLNGQGQVFASSVLAKHDENYMPKQVSEAIGEERA